MPLQNKTVTTEHRFIPHQMLQLLGINADEFKQSLSSASDPGSISKLLQKQREMKAVVLRVGIDGGEDLIRQIEPAEVFAAVNKLFALAVPAVRQFGGVIDRFLDDGFQALFTDERDAGLSAAIQIRENLLRESYEREDRVTIGLTYGNVSVGMIGYEERMSPFTISTHTGIGRFLQEKAYGYHAHILATGNLVDAVPDCATRFANRLLGSYYIESTESVEPIYDLFDGDDIATRQAKKKTKLLFEKGLELFFARDFVRARGFFIEVLKADRKDRAAREYLSLCDNFRGDPPKEGRAALCLERF
ncbi:MAG: hypothetical protein IJ682_02370 [Lachnospiraceae bacterium]|nr:hypothetical protein [Lachnospiraceae bacterium]